MKPPSWTTLHLLLTKYFSNPTLANAFVGIINNYRSRFNQPIEDYRIFVDLYKYSNKYFKIEVSVSSALRRGRAGNVKIACVKQGGNVFEVDPYAEECDFLWNFVPYASDSSIDESEFTLHGVTLDGQPVGMNDAVRGDGRIEHTSRQNIDADKNIDAIFAMQFSVLQRRDLSGMSIGMSRPAKELSVQLNYRDLDVDDINAWSFLVGSQTIQPLIEYNKAQKRFVVRYKGWVMNGSGLVLHGGTRVAYPRKLKRLTIPFIVRMMKGRTPRKSPQSAKLWNLVRVYTPDRLFPEGLSVKLIWKAQPTHAEIVTDHH